LKQLVHEKRLNDMVKLSTEKPVDIVTGAAGFIGSHLVDRLLEDGHAVIGIDNFTRGRWENLWRARRYLDFQLVNIDCADLDDLRRCLVPLVVPESVDTVWHLAANSDIPAGVASSEVDFKDTFLTTYRTVGLMRELGLRRLAFASSSAIYGAHERPLSEDSGPLLPESNYGAMKLASEAIISAAVQTHLERAWIFRFPNVIGSRGTHGVIYDLLHKLRAAPPVLEVLGDGSQCKPYMHVADLVDAMLHIRHQAGEQINCVNIAAQDEGATVRYIAEEVVRLAAPSTPIRYGKGERGWVGDVPRFSFRTDKLQSMGWSPRWDSRAAVRRAVTELAREIMA
jgi:UDP-glucose 4-epimerase